MLLSENTSQGQHTCFKLCVLADEMRFTALSMALMISWGMHLNVYSLVSKGISSSQKIYLISIFLCI